MKKYVYRAAHAGSIVTIRIPFVFDIIGYRWSNFDMQAHPIAKNNRRKPGVHALCRDTNMPAVLYWLNSY